MEASGAEVLEELVVDIALRTRAAQAGVEIDELDIQAEHARLLSLLREQTDASTGVTSAELIDQLQRSRGLEVDGSDACGISGSANSSR